jgi:hypothetical protein
MKLKWPSLAWGALLLLVYLGLTGWFYHSPRALPCHCGCRAPVRVLCNSPVCQCHCPTRSL